MLFAGLDHVQRMAADAGRHAEFLGQLDRLGDQVDLALRHQRIGVDAPQVNGLAAVLDQALDVLAILGHVRLDRRGGADDPLNLAAALLAVAAQHRHGMLRVVHRDGIDPGRLGLRQRLHDLLVGVVVRGERIDVFQVAAVGVVGEQVAAQDQAAHLQLADLALGQGARRGGLVWVGPLPASSTPARGRRMTGGFL